MPASGPLGVSSELPCGLNPMLGATTMHQYHQPYPLKACRMACGVLGGDFSFSVGVLSHAPMAKNSHLGQISQAITHELEDKCSLQAFGSCCRVPQPFSALNQGVWSAHQHIWVELRPKMALYAAILARFCPSFGPQTGSRHDSCVQHGHL